MQEYLESFFENVDACRHFVTTLREANRATPDLGCVGRLQKESTDRWLFTLSLGEGKFLADYISPFEPTEANVATFNRGVADLARRLRIYEETGDADQVPQQPSPFAELTHPDALAPQWIEVHSFGESHTYVDRAGIFVRDSGVLAWVRYELHPPGHDKIHDRPVSEMWTCEEFDFARERFRRHRIVFTYTDGSRGEPGSPSPDWKPVAGGLSHTLAYLRAVVIDAGRVSSPAVAVPRAGGADASAVDAGPVSLRDMLQRDFGVDLPISGGGGRRVDPIVVHTSSLQEAVDVQMQVHRCIGKGRRIAWRLEDTTVAEPERKLVRSGLETVVFLEDQVRTNGEALYFIFEALGDGGTTVSLPAPSGFHDPGSGLRLPYQLGWLHLDSTTDYERESPGLGYSAAYGGLGVTMTVYVYPWDQPPSRNSIEVPEVQEHLELVLRDVVKAHPSARLVHRDVMRDRSGEPRFLAASFELPDDVMTYVMLTARHGCYVKLRVTCGTPEQKINETMWQSVGALVDLLYGGRAVDA